MLVKKTDLTYVWKYHLKPMFLIEDVHAVCYISFKEMIQYETSYDFS